MMYFEISRDEFDFPALALVLMAAHFMTLTLQSEALPPLSPPSSLEQSVLLIFS
jgi:hypothetical protein